jgi:hypothetical protein
MSSGIRAQARRLVVVLTALFACTAAFLTPAPKAVAERGAYPGIYNYHPNDTSYRYDGIHGSFTGDVIYATQNAEGGNR